MEKSENVYKHTREILAKYSRNLRHVCLIALCLFACAAHAQRVLILTTRESPGFVPWLTGIRDAYQAAGATSIDYRYGVLNRTTPAPTSLFADKDVVVIAAAGNGAINAVQYNVLANVMKNRPNPNGMTFVFYLDPCCGQTYISDMVSPLNGVTGWGLGSIHINSSDTLPLNTASPYQSFFSDPALATIPASAYSVLTNVPANNIIYKDSATPTPGKAHTIFVPRREANHGNGACVLFSGDMNMMAPGSPRSVALARAAMDLNASTHCKDTNTGNYAVPTLQGWGLGLLAVGMGALAWRRQRRRVA